MRKSILLLILVNVLYSCAGLKEAGKILRNEKINTTDEFLIQKKEPLTVPPNMDKMPEPGGVTEKKDTSNKIKKILQSSEANKVKNKNNSLEKSILNEIKK